ncbi:MAG: DNA topoisomerase IB [Catenulispora sp.]
MRRIRHGRGFRYVDAAGQAVDADTKRRIKELVIPPAWQDVWICPWPNGHIQATGVDDAGRRQYLYHPQWRVRQDRLKHDHALEFARRLPKIRSIVDDGLAGSGLTRERVLCTAVALLDIGVFRIGSRQYAQANGSYGLSTLHRSHVRIRRDEAEFSYVAKGGQRQTTQVTDPRVVDVLRRLVNRKGGGQQLLAFREDGRWQPVRSRHINDFLREAAGMEVTAKDFRTWHATVFAAVALAVSTHVDDTQTARRRAVARAVAETADFLGNTPAVCRASYIDDRLIDRYLHGETIAAALPALGREAAPGTPAIHGDAERAVLRLLSE